MEEEISLVEIFDILKKRLGLIIGFSLAGLLISAVFTFYIAPELFIPLKFKTKK